MSSILIKNAIIVDSNSNYNNTKKDILLENGVISSIKDNITDLNVEIIESDNLHICPGLFDFSVDFPEPGNEQKETLDSGYKSAISGGFTGIGLQPTIDPSRDQKSDILFCINSSKEIGIEVIPYGSLSMDSKGEQLSEMYDMYTAGSLAFTDNTRPVAHGGLFSRALLYAKKL
jgi:dihydroorotase